MPPHAQQNSSSFSCLERGCVRVLLAAASTAHDQGHACKLMTALSHNQLYALQDGQTVQTIQGVQVPGLTTNVEMLSLVAAKA